MATKLSSDPIGPRLNAEVVFAVSGSVLVVPLRSWEYAFLSVSTRWHYHLCTRLQKTQNQDSWATKITKKTKARVWLLFLPFPFISVISFFTIWLYPWAILSLKNKAQETNLRVPEKNAYVCCRRAFRPKSLEIRQFKIL